LVDAPAIRPQAFHLGSCLAYPRSNHVTA
jgi:hypothetical protein